MRKGHRRIAFWVAVAGTSILANVGLRIAADRLPFQGLKTLDNYVTRQGGN